jgi:hypothetical protein
MKPRKIVRPKQAMANLGCGHTKFYADYVYHDGGDENVPGTTVPRLRLLRLGPRNSGVLEHEIDALIDGLAALRDAGPSTQPAITAQGKANEQVF